MRAGSLRQRGKGEADIVLFTALPEEAFAFEDILKGTGARWRARRPLQGLDSKIFELGDFGETITCALVVSAGMGRLESAISATIVCMEFQPKFLLLVGIAGGFREGRWSTQSRQIKLGDILIANELFDLESKRVSARDEIQLRPKVLYVGDPELRIARAVGESSSWCQSMPITLQRESQPQVHFGPIVSGDVLLASDEFPTISKMYQSDIVGQIGEGPIGIEMEGTGVALAVRRYNSEAGFLMIRSVSDYADRSKKSDESFGRHLATYSAASFALGVITSNELKLFLRAR